VIPQKRINARDACTPLQPRSEQDCCGVLFPANQVPCEDEIFRNSSKLNAIINDRQFRQGSLAVVESFGDPISAFGREAELFRGPKPRA